MSEDDEPQTGQEAIDEIGKTPTLDIFFDRNPREMGDEEWLAVIEGERQKRALFIEKKGK